MAFSFRYAEEFGDFSELNSFENPILYQTNSQYSRVRFIFSVVGFFHVPWPYSFKMIADASRIIER